MATSTVTKEITVPFEIENMSQKFGNFKVLMVGAGGIGCELLKNLVLTGFENIELVNMTHKWIFFHYRSSYSLIPFHDG